MLNGKSFINCWRCIILMYLIFLFWSSFCSLGCNIFFFDFGIKFENEVRKIGLFDLNFIRFLVFNKYSGSFFILL